MAVTFPASPALREPRVNGKSRSNGHPAPVPSPDGEARAWRFFLGFLGVSTLLRLVAAAVLPLSGDEAYYWQWSQHPAFGYYDHPPMVAWCIRLSMSLLGSSPLAARLGALLSMTIVPLLVAHLAFDVTGRRGVAALAGSFCLLAPYLVVEGGFITPNSPFLLFWCVALWLYHKALMQEKPSLKVWLLAGVALGLSCLSKLMALLMVPSLLLFLVVSRRHRALLRTPLPYLSLLAALLVFSPFLAWNAANGWESFRYQLFLRHLSPDMKYSGVLHFLLLQAASISPLLLVLCGVATLSCWRRGLRQVDSGSSLYLACMAGVTVVFFGLYSIFGQVELYWTLGGFLPAFVAAAAFFCRSRLRAKAAVLGLIVAPSALVTLLIYTGILCPPVTLCVARLGSPPDYRGNGVTEMYSYQQLARDIGRVQSQLSPDAFVVTDSYSLSAVLSFYSGRYVHTLTRNLQGQEWRRWENLAELRGRDAVYVDRDPVADRQDIRRMLEGSFAHVEADEPRTYLEAGIPSARYYLVRCHGFAGAWHPEARLHLGSDHRPPN